MGQRVGISRGRDKGRGKARVQSGVFNQSICHKLFMKANDWSVVGVFRVAGLPTGRRPVGEGEVSAN